MARSDYILVVVADADAAAGTRHRASTVPPPRSFEVAELRSYGAKSHRLLCRQTRQNSEGKAKQQKIEKINTGTEVG